VSDNISISSYREYDEGVRGVVYEDERLRIMCNEGVLRSMYDHSIKGLPGEEGGTIDGRAVEVKGYLLGSVTIEDDVHVVEIKKTVPLPIGNFDHGEGAYFDASDEARLSHYLKRNPELQMVGNFHSHPNHPIMLSDADVKYLSGVLAQPFHVAVVVAPREKALGLFVKNEEGNYAIEQEHDVRVSFDATGKPRVRWLAVDKEHVEKVSEFPLKKVAIIAAAAVAVIVLAILIIGGGESAPPVVSASPAQITFDKETQNAEIAVTLDQEGEYTIQLTPTADYPWLEIVDSQQTIVHPRKSYHRIRADLMALASNETIRAYIGISAFKKTEDPPNIAEAHVAVEAVRSVNFDHVVEPWELPTPRVRNRKVVFDIGEIPTQDSKEVDVSVRTVGGGGSSREVYGTTLQNPESVSISASQLNNPLEWDRVVLEARATETLRGQNIFRTYEHRGSRSLDKRDLEWDMTCEQTGRDLVFSAAALDYPAYWRLRTREDGAWQPLRESQSDADSPFSERIQISDDVESYCFEAAYVGSSEIVHLTFNYSIDEVDRSIANYDDTQGRAGREFRRQHPDIFAEAELKKFGDYGGPRHIDDLPGEERGAKVGILHNNRVHDWAPLVDIDRQASSAGHGRIAWDYAEGYVKVYIVITVDSLRSHARGRSWFLKQKFIADLVEGYPEDMYFFDFDGNNAGLFKRAD